MADNLEAHLLAWPVIGRLVSATFLTIFILPVVYVIVMALGSAKTPKSTQSLIWGEVMLT